MSLAIINLSPERVAVVRRLNEAGIPVIAWLLLPKEQGCFLTIDNLPQIMRRYADFEGWTAQPHFRWAGVGLDLELNIREFETFAKGRRRFFATWLGRALDDRRLRVAQLLAGKLIDLMHADGYNVDCYQLFTFVDLRRTGSRIMQRTIGQFAVPADREVLMLYTSMFAPLGSSLGPGILWNYA